MYPVLLLLLFSIAARVKKTINNTSCCSSLQHCWRRGCNIHRHPHAFPSPSSPLHGTAFRQSVKVSPRYVQKWLFSFFFRGENRLAGESHFIFSICILLAALSSHPSRSMHAKENLDGGRRGGIFFLGGGAPRSSKGPKEAGMFLGEHICLLLATCKALSSWCYKYRGYFLYLSSI